MHHRTPRHLSSLLLAAALTAATAAAGGCNAFSVKTPENFVSLKRMRSKLHYKAVSPDNAVISIRSFEHRDKGSLAFWTEILRREMTLRKGYRLKATDAVKTDGGTPGVRLTFATKSGKTQYTYATALFVTKKYIHVIQTAAKADIYEKHVAQFDAAVASFRPR